MHRPVAVSTLLACSLAVLVGAASGPARAWSVLGHQLVGDTPFVQIGDQDEQRLLRTLDEVLLGVGHRPVDVG